VVQGRGFSHHRKKLKVRRGTQSPASPSQRNLGTTRESGLGSVTDEAATGTEADPIGIAGGIATAVVTVTGIVVASERGETTSGMSRRESS